MEKRETVKLIKQEGTKGGADVLRVELEKWVIKDLEILIEESLRKNKVDSKSW